MIKFRDLVTCSAVLGLLAVIGVPGVAASSDVSPVGATDFPRVIPVPQEMAANGADVFVRGRAVVRVGQDGRVATQLIRSATSARWTTSRHRVAQPITDRWGLHPVPNRRIK
jgi:hypothetical protein